ncbi:MAG: helix-turn-helix domain-containing protein [Cetobacterium sp.]
MVEISKFLNEIISKKGILMTDISKLVGVSNQFLSDLKKGKKSCKEETWEEIINYLRLDKTDEEKAWRAWSLDRMDKKTKNYLLKL